MKRFSMLLAAGLALLAFAGCATQPQITPTQFFAIACPPAQQVLAIAPTLAPTLIPANVQAALPDVTKIVHATCAQGATVSTANVTAFANTVLPAVSAIVGVVPDGQLDQATKDKIQGGIALAELGVTTVTAVQNAAAAQAASAPAAASGVIVAPAAPVPASGTLVAAS